MLISLIARHPKKSDTLSEMVTALETLAEQDKQGTDENKKIMTIIGELFKGFMTENNKSEGEALQPYEVSEILTDCKLLHNDSINITDLAKYLMSK